MVLSGLLLLVIIVVGVGTLAYATTPTPSLNANALKATTTVYYSDGTTVMAELNDDGIDRKPLTEEQMPKSAKDAAVASEDRTFYENKGVSVTGIARAVWGVVTGNPDLGGGSTITQQYVKNITGNDQRAYTRKATEAIQALKVDQQYEKDQILTSYLNTVYFGRGAYGIAAATEAYFGPTVDPTQLTHEQAALLIGILPAPSAWDPANSPENAQKRYSYVMDAMQKMGSISADEVAANPTMPEAVKQEKPKWFQGPRGYVLNAIVKELAAPGYSFTGLDGINRTLKTADDVAAAGLKIVSTIDAAKQQAAEETMGDTKVFPAKGRPETLRAGLISIDPTTGGVVAMYGGPDYLTQPFDAVNQGMAQAGSTFKPITLLAALQNGTTDGQKVELSDTFNGSSPQTFGDTPTTNFSNEQFGNINLVKATADSVNTVYVHLNQEIGPRTTAKTAEQLGITMEDNSTSALANVLGSSAVLPIQMAQAYAALANGGTVHPAHYIQQATVGDSDVYVVRTDPNKGEKPFKDDAVADTVYAMQAVTKPGGTAASIGSAFGKRPIAGKTGTTNKNRAAWFNGFTPQLQTAVVLYNSGPNGEELSIPGWGGVREVTGATYPTRIWTSYMQKALKGTKIEQFARPSEQVSSEPSPTPSATPTDTASASPSDSVSPSDSPSDDGDGPDGGDGPSNGPSQSGPGQNQGGNQGGGQGQNQGDTTDQAAGPPGLADRVAARLGQARPGPGATGAPAGGQAGGPAGRTQG
ncbi:Membrane carboxypeptidase (penicillin-binding protein) [Quadrisphaera granulorum]|uniref:Membrane peptidoglycan carboxypeptidase n=1 Tax=Quadrisphaera granulorum TaxID=317664 RepID=A0A316ADU4_9ACTN|nr:membrane peptidoglycan carboxypeptidase [Quadrisphaera granulorum]SZE95279.1 Membrane carboxypeptidase (penicillin-binding protein) [Quadrisphaera granulorum]